MKKTISLMVCLLCCLMAGAQSMKVVLDKNGEVLDRYVRTNATTYNGAILKGQFARTKGEKTTIRHRIVPYIPEIWCCSQLFLPCSVKYKTS